ARSSRSAAIVLRLVGGEIELDARAVRVVEEHLPRPGRRKSATRVLDVSRREERERVRESGRRKRHVIDHAGLELVARTAADDMKDRAVAGIEPCARKCERG